MKIYLSCIKCKGRGLYCKNINLLFVLKKPFQILCFAFSAATSEGGLREPFAVPNDKFLKSVFNFGAGNTCVTLRRHVFVTSHVLATRFFFAYCFSFSDLTKLKPTHVTIYFISQASKGLK